MSSPPLPRLRDDVVVATLDTSDPRSRYRVEVDGRHFVIDRSTAFLVDELRRTTNADSIALELSRALDQLVTANDIRYAVEQKLPKVLFEKIDEAPKSPLSWQVELASARTLNSILSFNSVLFRSKSVITMVMIFVALEVLMLPILTEPVRALHWTGALTATVLTLIGVAIHELGHLSACHHFRARHGGFGFGLYWIFPTFYADVTGTWSLSRMQRAAVDVGGLYFQSIYLSIFAIWALSTKDPTIPVTTLLLSHTLMLYTLNPVLKFDGYWLLSDISGTVNLHQRINETARKILGRVADYGHTIRFADILVLVSFLILATAFFGHLMWMVITNASHSFANVWHATSLMSVLSSGTLLALTLLLLSVVSLRLLRAMIKVFR